MVISWPSNTVNVIDEIRDAIGRNVIINIPITGIACTNPSDHLDPVTNLSTNQFCPTCHGAYWLNSISGVTVIAHVTWKPAEIPMWYPGGQIVEGDCLVQIKYTASAYTYVTDAESFIVDGKTLTKRNIILRGVPQTNRILVALDQQE
jgi:hypothetical protein